MKFLFILLCSFFYLGAGAQTKGESVSKPDTSRKIEVVETACGQCRLGLPGEGCDLAVRINGVSYFVDGTHIDEHGDAHATDGFCNAVRKAAVQGTVVNNRFKVTYFKLAKEEKGPKKDTKQ